MHPPALDPTAQDQEDPLLSSRTETPQSISLAQREGLAAGEVSTVIKYLDLTHAE